MVFKLKSVPFRFAIRDKRHPYVIALGSKLDDAALGVAPGVPGCVVVSDVQTVSRHINIQPLYSNSDHKSFKYQDTPATLGIRGVLTRKTRAVDVTAVVVLVIVVEC